MTVCIDHFIIFFWVWLFCLLVCLYTMCIHCPQRPKEDIGSPGTGVTGGYEMVCER